ncbi:hypothetical protein SS50377_25954 [Spironucleus salmonicida]|uniref:Uncharacterized protein n=1 Tax=Spironucleus salmonicida TaxID=348837 RepID=V6LQA3_9EUKA|nr:hypothetical protein SS50377_25954 [Spironucleus salmonicida]|eukprot:EST46760.1 Hypothetical protein SS50377_13222 [Spironucleus salmonicida]
MKCRKCDNLIQQYNKLQDNHTQLQQLLIQKASQNSIFSPTFRRVEIPSELFVDVEDQNTQTDQQKSSSLLFNTFEKTVTQTLQMLNEKLKIQENSLNVARMELTRYKDQEMLISNYQKTTQNLTQKLSKFSVSPILNQSQTIVSITQPNTQTKDPFYQQQNEQLQEQISLLQARITILEIPNPDSQLISFENLAISVNNEQNNFISDDLIELRERLNILEMENSTLRCQIQDQHMLNSQLSMTQKQLKNSQCLREFEENEELQEMIMKVRELENSQKQEGDFQQLQLQYNTLQSVLEGRISKNQNLQIAFQEVEKLYKCEIDKNSQLQLQLQEVKKQLQASRKVAEELKMQEKRLLEKLQFERRRMGAV